jgi:lysophospholipase L1-like esterase
LTDKNHIKTWTYRFFGLVLACLILIGFECVLRIARPDLATPVERFRLNTQKTDARRFSALKIPDPDLLWVLKPSSSLSEHETLNSHGFRGPDFSTAKAPDVYRIVILGDSRSFGFGLENIEEIYSQRLQRFFDQSYERGTVEILNLSVIGYSSYQGKKLFTRIGRHLKPNLVVVWFGFNDLLYYHISDHMAAYRPAILKHVFCILNRAYLFHWLSGIWKVHLNPSGKMIDMEQPITERVPLENYEQNLREIVQDIHETGARACILSTPVRRAPPLVLNSLIRKTVSDTGRTRVSLVTQYDIDGHWLMNAHEFPGTEAELDMLLEKNPDIAILHHFKALKLLEKGENESAERSFSDAEKLDHTRMVVRRYNEIAQQVAREMNAAFIDLIPVYETYSHYPLFLDDCHPSSNGHNLIASRIVETITGIPSRSSDSSAAVSETGE